MRVTTIRDVARRAGVSVGTVSNVLNGKVTVQPAIRRRVETAIAELEYRPDETARSLRTRETRFVALVIANILNPTFLPYIKAVEDVLSGAGYNVLMCNSDNQLGKEADLLRQLVDRNVAGIILTPVHLSKERVAPLRGARIPLVLTLRPHSDASLETVVPNYCKGALAATRHLAGLGHTRIAHVLGPEDWSTGQSRLDGYRRGLAEADLPLDPRLVLATDLTTEQAHAAMRNALRGPAPPTAVIAATDPVARGVFAAAAECGARVPADLSVVVFGTTALPMPHTLVPTTVDLQVADLGRNAARMLLDRIRGHEDGPARHLLLDIALVPGYSTGPPAAVAAERAGD